MPLPKLPSLLAGLMSNPPEMAPPSNKSNPKEISWDKEVDVVIVGFGGAGACAALEAAQAGAKVLVLDRFDGGGAATLSGGIVYAGGGTTHQKAAGFEDTPQNMFNYLKLEVQDAVAPETLKTFCEESNNNLQWLEAQGVQFDSLFCPYKTSYPVSKYALVYSGNEAESPYNTEATPAPRGHLARGKDQPGKNFFEPLRKSVGAQGRIEVCLQSQAQELILGEKGEVLGLEYTTLPQGSFWSKIHHFLLKLAQNIRYLTMFFPKLAVGIRNQTLKIESNHAVRCQVRARQGVILTAGGFIFNRKMVNEYASPYRKGMPLGTRGDDGSGIMIGHRAGAATGHMDRVSAWRFINPPEAFLQGVMVNAQGQRFCNERLYGAQIGEKMVEHHQGKSWLVIDTKIWKKAHFQIGWNRAKWFQTALAVINLYFNHKKANSLKELESLCHIPENQLQTTINEYNHLATSQGADPLGKVPELLIPLQTPPYYAIDCSIDSRLFPCPTLTLGGLVVEEQSGQVKREDGTLIPGLYAAGRNAVGIASHSYISGLSLADCVFSGRRVGQQVIKRSATSSDSTSTLVKETL